MRLSESQIQQVRTAADIVDVVSGFVRLRKTGRNFTGLCPFHKEKTPSFNVNPERQIFKCFGCGKGGDVISFIMEMEHVSFMDAVEELAERFGIALEHEDGVRPERKEDMEGLYAATKIAARFFYDSLRGDGGEPGREYFKRRGWTEETMKTFGLGYAPAGWSNFLDHARAKGLDENILDLAGLVKLRDGGGAYDRFRHRVIFPIIHVTRKVLGFGARALSAEDEPKYLNSPESAIYNKSKVLYGLSQASNAIREAESIIVVEGYADVLSLHQAGIRNVVSTSGTAMTPDQVHAISRYTRNIFFLYDADSAGLRAMLRGIDVILAEDCDARIVQLAAGEDPDSFVMKYGAEAVRERMEQAVSFVDFVTAQLRADGKLDSPEGRAQAVHQIVGMLSKMDDALRREFYIHHIAQTYGIYENLLYQELAKVMKGAKRRERAAVIEEHAPPPAEAASESVPKEEFAFCSHLLQAPPEIQAEALHSVRIGHFRSARIRDLLHILFEQEEHDGAVDSNALWNYVQDDAGMHTLLADLLMPKDEVSSGWSRKQNVNPKDHRRVLRDYYKEVLEARIDEQLVKLRTMQKKVSGPEDENELASRIMALQKVASSLNGISLISDFPDIDGEDEMSTDTETSFGF
jgi:DNA primase